MYTSFFYVHVLKTSNIILETKSNLSSLFTHPGWNCSGLAQYKKVRMQKEELQHSEKTLT